MQLENAHEYSLPSVLHWAAADGRAARAAIAIIWMRSIMEEGREDFYGTCMGLLPAQGPGRSNNPGWSNNPVDLH